MSYASKQYWQARANQCTEFADEGACLARIARHVPVTIGGLGGPAQGLGGNMDGLNYLLAGVVGVLGLTFALGFRASRRRRNRR